MTKSELIALLAEKNEVSKKVAGKLFDDTFEAIKGELLKGEAVQVSGFGVFKPKTTKARDGLNPATKEKVHIPSKKSVSFKVAKAFKDELN